MGDVRELPGEIGMLTQDLPDLGNSGLLVLVRLAEKVPQLLDGFPRLLWLSFAYRRHIIRRC